MIPSSRTFYVLALTTLLGAAGIVRPSLALLALGLDAALLIALVIDVRRLRGITLDATRTWPPLLVQGAPAELTLELRNPHARALRVRLRETLHPALDAAPQRTELEFSPGQRQQWSLELHPRRRGDHRSGPLMARFLGPWGLAWQQRELLGEVDRRVYPQVRWQGKVGRLLLLADRRSLGQNPLSLAGHGTEPYALREYLPGDAPSKIHWKATARHGRLVTREDTWERGARLLILLDCARGMSGVDAGRSKLDHALAAALALTRVAAARGDRTTVLAFSDRIERSVRIHGGRRGLATAYSRLYDLEARLTEPAFDLATQSAMHFEARRSTAVLFTSVVDLAAAELLRRSLLQLKRRHRPILINLLDPELIDLAKAEPDRVEQAFAKVSALEILLANRRLGTRLRHAGIRVVNTSADRLTLETLEAYLAMFHRQIGCLNRDVRTATKRSHPPMKRVPTTNFLEDLVHEPKPPRQHHHG